MLGIPDYYHRIIDEWLSFKLELTLFKGTSKNSNLPLLAKFTYRVVIALHLTAVSFVAMPSARKIYLKSYQKQFLEVPLIFQLISVSLDGSLYYYF